METSESAVNIDESDVQNSAKSMNESAASDNDSGVVGARENVSPPSSRPVFAAGTEIVINGIVINQDESANSSSLGGLHFFVASLSIVNLFEIEMFYSQGVC